MAVYDYQIIANFLAGKSLAKIRLQEIKKFLDKHHQTYRVLEIIKYTPISQIPENGSVEIKKGVICLGGDGTISETLGYMAKRNINAPIFVVPTGTANFIAKSVGVRTDVDYNKLFKVKLKGFDLGICEAKDRTHYYLIGIGFGFEQKFLEMAKEKSKKFFGKISYFLGAFIELFKLKPLSYQVVLNNQKLDFQTAMLTALNFKPVISKFVPIFKEKDIKQDDGLLDVFYVEHKNYFLSLLGIVFFHVLGKYNFGLVKRIKTQKIEINSSMVQKVQIDGEVKGQLPFRVSVIPGGVRFLV